jgi:ligand-binding sensor domain-containing protein
MSGLQSSCGRSGLFGRRGRWIQRLLLFALLPALSADETAVARAWSVATPAVVSKATNAAPAMQYTRRIWRIQDGLPEDTVQAIQQSQDGYLWIGTTGGLVRFDGSHFHLYNHSTTPALADNSVFSILGARDGSLWLGTEGGGLVHLKDGVFRAYTQAAGLSNGFVRSLIEDDERAHLDRHGQRSLSNDPG